MRERGHPVLGKVLLCGNGLHIGNSRTADTKGNSGVHAIGQREARDSKACWKAERIPEVCAIQLATYAAVYMGSP